MGEEDTEEVSIALFLKVPETQTQAGQVFQEEEVLRGDVINDGGFSGRKMKTHLVENLNVPELEVIKKTSIQ